MEYRKLGNTKIDVSAICLGTMTWGQQNTEKEAHAQLDFALERGINFIDTAEMYPVPPKAETYSLTEQYIGTWLAGRADRDKIILASKVFGPSNSLTYARYDYARGGKQQTRLDRGQIIYALDESLRRLQTDYVDLYQLHWPQRETNYFGQLGYVYRGVEDIVPIEETLLALDEVVKSGKVRYVGVSNETPWGLSEFLKIAEHEGLESVISIQNPYNLLNRSYEVGLAEMSIRENIAMMAYSPLGFGVLSGKYLGGAEPQDARLALFDTFQRYRGQKAARAVERYVGVAKKNGLDPAQMALSYVNSRPFVTSNIIGATNLDQLKDNIESINIKLSDIVLEAIEEIHQDIPNPCP